MAVAARAALVLLLGLRLGGCGLGRGFGGRVLGGLLRLLQGFLGGGLFCLAIVFGAAALFLAGAGLRLVFAAARFLERGHARFRGLAKQPLLRFLAARDVVDRRRARGLRRRFRLGRRLRL